MAEHQLIESARSGDLERAQLLVAAGADLETRDEHGWTALCWAAGAGHETMIAFLLESGADPFAADQDRRTPYLIALAANRTGVAKRLAEAEARSGRDEAVALSSGRAVQRSYCRAYPASELRRFSGSGQALKNLPPDETIVFIHHDFSITGTIWPREEVLFDGASQEWRDFCTEQLGFQPPAEIE